MVTPTRPRPVEVPTRSGCPTPFPTDTGAASAPRRGWFTGAGTSSAHATHEGMQVYREMAARQHDGDGDTDEWPVGPPIGYAVVAADDTIRSVVDPGAGAAHWSEFDVGGHFPAMEVPDLLAGDLRTFFADLR